MIAGRGGSDKETVALAKVAVNCACGLLVAVPHFNFRTELLKIVVEGVSVRKVDETFVKCRTTLCELFRADEDGGPSCEAVQLLSKMMKAKHYHVDESVLNTFLSLRLLSELDVKGSNSAIDNPRKRKKKDREFRTKKARKLDKEHKATEKEMLEADVTVSREEREKRQSETLKLVFSTYFRILKEKPPGLMGATLEGLAKYAHLINLDFFGDLLVALRELVSDVKEEERGVKEEEGSEQADRNTVREALLCIITAFALLSGQGTLTNLYYYPGRANNSNRQGNNHRPILLHKPPLRHPPPPLPFTRPRTKHQIPSSPRPALPPPHLSPHLIAHKPFYRNRTPPSCPLLNLLLNSTPKIHHPAAPRGIHEALADGLAADA